MMDTLLVPLLILLVIGLGVGGTFWFRRFQARQALKVQLERLLSRVSRELAPHLSARQQQLRGSLTQSLSNLSSGAVRTEDLARVIPKLHQQVARLEQDQQLHLDIVSFQEKLEEWMRRFDEVPPDSELFELKRVAQNALRMTQAHIQEGDLDKARETALHADILLKRQMDSVQATSRRFKELKSRITTLLSDAERSKAPILVRARWLRLQACMNDLKDLEKQGRLTDATIAATRLVGELEQLSGELKEQLWRLMEERRVKAQALFAELLLWPPGSDEERQRCQGFAERLETPISTDGRSLDAVREALELLEGHLEEGNTLAKVHQKRWQDHVATLLSRLKEGAAQALAAYFSLPADVASELAALTRLRTRIEPRLGQLPGWQVADEAQEVLEREQRLVAGVQALETRLRGRLEEQGRTLERLSRYFRGVLTDPAALEALQGELPNLLSRLKKRDLATLETDARSLELRLNALLDQARSQAFREARQALEAMEVALAGLRREGLQEQAGAEGVKLEKEARALKHRLDEEDVVGALELAGSWLEQAPLLLDKARRTRNRQLLEELRQRATPPPELAGLPQASRESVLEDLIELRARLTELEPQVEVDSGIETALRRVGEDLNWLMLKVRKELAQIFLDSYHTHQDLLQRLESSTVRFYLSEEAVELLTAGRKTQAECTPLLKGDDLVAVELIRRLQQQTRDLERVWREALPQARRFYEKQLNMLEIELGAVDASLLPPALVKSRDRLLARTATIREDLTTDGWEESVRGLEQLSMEARALADQADQHAQLRQWWETQRKGLQQKLASLSAVGCQQEERLLRAALEAWEEALARGAGVEEVEERRKLLVKRQEEASQALRTAVEELETSRREQGELEKWRHLLSLRKQDLDWLRSCLKDVMSAGADGLDLRTGLQTLQLLQRSLDPISLDLRGAAQHDQAFRDWMAKVRGRAEAQFRSEFRADIESLHEPPASIKALCAELLTHIDSVLSSGQAEPQERETYEKLQVRGDAYHKLFGKKFSFQQ